MGHAIETARSRSTRKWSAWPGFSRGIPPEKPLFPLQRPVKAKTPGLIPPQTGCCNGGFFNIGREYLHRRRAAQCIHVLAKQHRERVRFLACSATRHPDSNRAIRLLTREKPRDDSVTTHRRSPAKLCGFL
jgi:hypothetical protein